MDENEVLKRQFANAPKDIQDLIRSSGFDSQVQKIALKYGLSPDIISSLEDEIIFVLVGLQSKTDFVGNIEHELNMSHQTALTVANEVDRDIFTRVHESLENLENILREAENKESNTGESLARNTLINEIENPQPSQMKTVTPPRPMTSPVPTYQASPIARPQATPMSAPPVSQTPQNLPTMPEHHEIMKYYAGTEPIMPEQIDYSGPVPLKKKDSPMPPKLADTPRYETPKYVPPGSPTPKYTPPGPSAPANVPSNIPRYNSGTDPYREPSR